MPLQFLWIGICHQRRVLDRGALHQMMEDRSVGRGLPDSSPSVVIFGAPEVGWTPTAASTAISAATVAEVPTAALGLESISIAREFPGVILWVMLNMDLNRGKTN